MTLDRQISKAMAPRKEMDKIKEADDKRNSIDSAEVALLLRRLAYINVFCPLRFNTSVTLRNNEILNNLF